MKKLSVLFALLAVAMMAKASADLVVTADPIVVEPGTTTAKLNIKSSETVSQYAAFQLDIAFPEGITWKKLSSGGISKGSVKVRAKDEEDEYLHSVSSSEPAENTLRIVCYSESNAFFVDASDGVFVSLDLILDGDLEPGVYNVKLSNMVFASSGDESGVSASGDKPADYTATITINGAAETEVSFTMTAAHAGTLILPFDAEIPADFDWVAYSDITLNGKSLVLGTSTTTLLANTPYYIEGEKEGTYVFTGTPTNEAASVTNGILTGVFVDTEIAAGVGNYVLQNQEGKGVAFYNVKTKAKTVPAYRCYITVSSDTQSNMYRIGGTTNIDEVTVDDNVDVYDMLGRKVIGPLEKGVYIKGNRKIYVK